MLTSFFTKNRKAYNILLYAITAYASYQYITYALGITTRARVEIPINKALLTVILWTMVNPVMATLWFSVLITGVVQYIRTKGQKNKMLQFWLAVAFMNQIVTGARLIVSIAQYPTTVVEHPFDFFKDMFFTIIAAIVLYILNAGIQEQPEKVLQKNMQYTKWSRSLHVLLDHMLLIGLNMIILRGASYYRLNLSDPYYRWEHFGDLFSIAVGYFAIEAAFGITPSKIITGTRIVQTADGTKATEKQVAIRTLARFIPFETFSIFGKNLWHDKLSETSLVYTGTQNWLYRQAKIMYAVFIGSLVVGIWGILCHMLLITDELSGAYSSAAENANNLLVIAASATVVLFTCWIASIAHYSHTIAHPQNTKSNKHFTSALQCWIPFLNFTALYSVLADAFEDTSRVTGETPEMDNLSRSAIQLTWAFPIAYYLLIAGVGALYVCAPWDVQRFFTPVIASFSLIIWSAYAMLHAKAVQRVFKNIPTTTEAPSASDL